ncbi:integral membrane sensor signal transduction histidine kinase [Ktedonobacter racemifer DSM 44963]|uniref:histidine kinase n=2 Tax=Ktedonobacter racemifer TaxID=363277 RepID=D6TPK3_KTERA|nr:integral membrane sensor signal transduction histidine kinase [Ktedonobacter racemifer DSM 44963]
MRIHDEKWPESTDQTFWQKMICQFNSIRVRLTLWYAMTTIAVLVLFGGLLYSTIIKMLPSTSSPDLLRIAQQIFLLGLAILLFITAGGYWLATKAMRPVRLITRTAQEIGQTDLSRRFHLTSSDELGELAGTFDKMLNRLETVLNRQRQFTADASHELRTPLSMLTLATNRALSQRSKPESYAQALAMIAGYRQEFSLIQAETDHMIRLVNGLLLLARADIEQTILSPAEVDMSEVVLEVVERFAPLAQQRGIELVFGELPELCVQGDRLLLTLMVTNLIDNALRYTAGIGNHVLVEGRTARRGKQRWGRVWIEDNGPGIAEEHQSHLFERFYRVDVARSALQRAEEDIHEETTSGSGLGLAIVQWVAQVHQGEIRLHSTLGHGSCFEIWLPLLGDADENGRKDPSHLQL